MAGTRTWLTTPEGATPVDDDTSAEYWVAGPTVPTEPRPPSRFRGTVLLAIVYATVVGLTFLVAPAVIDTQDPTFGDGADEQDPTFEQPADG